MIELKKIRGNAGYRFIYDDGLKSTAWEIDPDDVDLDILQDVLNTARPPLAPTKPAIPIWEDTSQGMDHVREMLRSYEPVNPGAVAAEQAAHDEEMRLRNMGGALRTGINLAAEDIPVVDSDRNDLPDVNWGV